MPDAWAEEMCALNVEYNTDVIAAQTAFPEPDPRELVAVQEAWAGRRVGVEAAVSQATARLDDLAVPSTAEEFHAAIAAEIRSQVHGAPDFYDSVAAATALEQVDALVEVKNAAISESYIDSMRAVRSLGPELADAIAAVTGGCRFFEVDARSVPRGAPTADFSELAIDEPFDGETRFIEGSFEDGSEVAIGNSELTVTFPSGSGTRYLLTDAHQPSTFHDLRIEARIRNSGLGLAGVSCRYDGTTGYSVLVNPVGLMLIQRIGAGQALLGRAAAPEGFEPSAGYDLAVECLDGNASPARVVVYLDGVRIAEATDDAGDPPPEGLAALVSQWFAADSETVFEGFRVLVEP